jgi:hypothetical protein
MRNQPSPLLPPREPARTVTRAEKLQKPAVQQARTRPPQGKNTYPAKLTLILTQPKHPSTGPPPTAITTQTKSTDKKFKYFSAARWFRRKKSPGRFRPGLSFPQPFGGQGSLP